MNIEKFTNKSREALLTAKSNAEAAPRVSEVLPEQVEPMPEVPVAEAVWMNILLKQADSLLKKIKLNRKQKMV